MSRLILVRTVLVIINKYNLITCQLDVKTAFLNGEIKEEIYMEIPEGTCHTNKERDEYVCKLQRTMYGLRISPKRWNEKFTEVGLSLGVKNSDLDLACLRGEKERNF